MDPRSSESSKIVENVSENNVSGEDLIPEDKDTYFFDDERPRKEKGKKLHKFKKNTSAY